MSKDFDETTFDEDIEAMRKQVTAEVIFHINSSAKVYDEFKNLKDPQAIQDRAYELAWENDNEFGSVFEPELDVVDWDKVQKGI